MSDISQDTGAATEGTFDPEATPTLDFGAAKGTETQQVVETESTEAAQTEPAGQEGEAPLYTVKVDGEEKQVTLDELQAGFQRQADYTRKTQELAAERKRLRQAEALAVAIERDPQSTVKALADAYQIPIAQARQAVADAQQGDDGYVDPLEQRLSGLEQTLQQQVAQQQQAAAERQIQQHLTELREKYGEFDQEEVIHHAITRRVDLPTAYRDLNFDKIQRREAATEQKRQAQNVQTGAGTQRGVVKQPPKKYRTAREAIVGALESAGVDVNAG